MIIDVFLYRKNGEKKKKRKKMTQMNVRGSCKSVRKLTSSVSDSRRCSLIVVVFQISNSSNKLEGDRRKR
jgi:hypothetical protein